jgi:type II secretory pathway pseudopilin PulG
MRAGFTLMEVVVALMLMELAVLAAAGTLVLASRSMAEAEHLERAVMEAEGVLDSLSGVVAPTGGSRPYAGGGIDWLVDSAGVVLLTVTSAEGEIRLEVTSAVPRR